MNFLEWYLIENTKDICEKWQNHEKKRFTTGKKTEFRACASRAKNEKDWTWLKLSFITFQQELQGINFKPNYKVL